MDALLARGVRGALLEDLLQVLEAAVHLVQAIEGGERLLVVWI
jgi:hypothetical protein